MLLVVMDTQLVLELLSLARRSNFPLTHAEREWWLGQSQSTFFPFQALVGREVG